MSKFNGIKAITLSTISTLSLVTGINSATAVELSNGETAFETVPRLLKARTINNRINTHSSYQFTISVPEDAGEALEAVRIEQLDNVETIKLRDQTSRAFVGDKKTEVSLAAVGGKSEPGTLNFVFAQPIQPGNTVTVSVSPRLNPSTENIYQFGVTAFPEGDNSRGQFLGNGRLSFHSFR